jgi:Protein of unknown function (DUF2642)
MDRFELARRHAHRDVALPVILSAAIPDHEPLDSASVCRYLRCQTIMNDHTQDHGDARGPEATAHTGPPVHHPDLIELDRRLGDRLDRILRAEQQAAGLLARRSATLRDRLVDAEDAGARVSVTCLGGRMVEGRLSVVASDHLEVDSGTAHVLVALDQIVVVEIA